MKFNILETSNEYFHYGLRILLILVFGFILSRFLLWVINRYFHRPSSSKFKADPIKVNFFKNASTFLVLTMAITLIFYTIPALRAIGVTLFASAGIFAAILGFASQQAFSNIISGIFIVFFQPFRVGDIIKIGMDVHGTVEDITLRHTVIKNFENRRIIIPNSIISSETIINSNITDERMRNFVEIGISYDSSIELALNIMREEAMNHPLLVDGRSIEEKASGDPIVITKVIGFGDSSVNLRAYVWTKDFPDGWDIKTELYQSIKKRFDKEGIEIPFPYRTIVYKKDLPPNAADSE